MELIKQIEIKSRKLLMTLQVHQHNETAWLKRLVEEHPVFQGVPQEIKDQLVDLPAENLLAMGNRRRRKLWKKKGMLVHLFSGEEGGYTLGRAFHEVGGDRRLLHEVDVLHNKETSDLSPQGKGFPCLLRAALDGLVKGWIGGPPCRTRSMLRHFPVEGLNMPRPLRAWNGEEHGKHDLSPSEREQVIQDDVLLLRFVLLFIISEEVRKSKQEEEQVTLFLEQPADLDKMPEVVTLWRTKIWRALEELYGLRTQTFNQSEFASPSTKPTTAGGNLRLYVPMPGRTGKPREVEGKSKKQLCEESSSLSRWPPMMMREIAKSLQVNTMQGEVKIRALSWREHVAAGHTPFRRDCLVCQEAAAKDGHHRREKLPARVGVLSLDMTGPFHLGTDLNRKKGKYMLIGAFTWLAPRQITDDFCEDPLPEVPQGAPEIENGEEEEAEIEDADDVWGERQEERDRKAKEKLEEQKKLLESQKVEEGKEEEEKEIPKVVVTRLCTPLSSKNRHEVLKAIIDMYLRLKSDGFNVNQIHTDRGGEFCSEALERWCSSRTVLHTFTPGDQPQANGRVEVSVQWIKSEIRRILHASGSPFTLWPLAARNINERLRLKQVGKNPSLPNFMSPVLVRKRFWRARELQPTQEKALYIGPSWVHHGHWIQREDGTFALTRMVMHNLKEPPKDEDWIGLEDELAPAEVRRRIRGKVSLNHLATNLEEEAPEDGEDEEHEKEEQNKQLRRVIEGEMKHAVEDEPHVAFATLDAVTKIKEMTNSSQVDEVLQTKIVSQHEVRRSLDQWIPPIEAELESLFQKKGALAKISQEEVQRLVANDLAEVLPSKLVYTVKPSAESKGGKRKARLVACGNFAERSEADLFAGGATAVALRSAVAISSQKSWKGKVSDIRTAFLNAPMKLSAAEAAGGEESQPQKRAIIKPPPLLITAGLAKPGEHWEVLMALYGYKESPKLWSDHRDGVLAEIEIPLDGGGHAILDQMVTEPNLWRIQCAQTHQLLGLLLVYVDDLLVMGDSEILDATIKTIRMRWETSEPEEVNAEAGVRFLGTELYNKDGRWWMTQSNYIIDLLNRNLGSEPDLWPHRRLPMAAEMETREDPPCKDLTTIREAQRVVGELVWIATRTRPDLSYTINRLASMITKDPQQVIEVTKQVWGYLAATAHQGLLFENHPDEKQLNIYTDASFGEVCVGCHLVMWGGSILLWKSGKQAVITASTAESELVEILEGALAGDAVRVVLEEALDSKVRAVSHTDNMACISIVTGESGSWRTRHLRKRASILRAKVHQGDWLLRHLAGTELPADLGTKILSCEKYKKLKVLLGMYLGEDAEKEKSGQHKRKGGSQTGKAIQAEAAKTALQAIILFAKLAQVKSESAVQIWTEEPSKIISFSEPSSGLPFFLIVIMIFIFGMFTGAVLAWMMIYPYFHRVTLVESRHGFVPRPSFLMHPLPERDPNERAPQPKSAPQSKSAPQPRRGRDSRTSSSAIDAAGTAGASSAAGDAAGTAGASSAAGDVAGTAGASSAAGDVAGTAGASFAAGADAAGSQRRSSGASSTAAVSSSMTERGISRSGVRQRNSTARPRLVSLYVSKNGQRYHCDPHCHGLRKAHSIHVSPRCPDCGPEQSFPVEPLYGLQPGSCLHESLQHLRNSTSGGEIKKYLACANCMFSG